MASILILISVAAYINQAHLPWIISSRTVYFKLLGSMSKKGQLKSAYKDWDSNFVFALGVCFFAYQVVNVFPVFAIIRSSPFVIADSCYLEIRKLWLANVGLSICCQLLLLAQRQTRTTAVPVNVAVCLPFMRWWAFNWPCSGGCSLAAGDSLGVQILCVTNLQHSFSTSASLSDVGCSTEDVGCSKHFGIIQHGDEAHWEEDFTGKHVYLC